MDQSKKKSKEIDQRKFAFEGEFGDKQIADSRNYNGHGDQKFDPGNRIIHHIEYA